MTVPDSSFRNPSADSGARVLVQVYALTDVGKTREHNEDTFLVADLEGASQLDFATGALLKTPGAHGLLFLVADGMGGAASGEIASGMAGQVVLNCLTSAWSADGALSEDAFAAALRDATETANSRIHQFSRENPEHRGMGTTATLAGLFGDKLFLAQVGDSRAYLVRGGQAKQLTKDQSLMQRLVEAGELTQEEADVSERRNIILQALGPDAHVTVDLTHQQLRRGDVLLLCSDGLSGLVRADEIAQLASHADSVETLCHALVDRANERGGPDNITVIAARFDGPALAPLTVGDEYGYANFALREEIDPSAETIEARVPHSPFRSDPTPRFGTPLPSAAALEEEFARARAAEEAAAMGAPDDVVEERRRRVQPIFLFLLILGGVALLWMLYKLLFTAAPAR